MSVDICMVMCTYTCAGVGQDVPHVQFLLLHASIYRRLQMFKHMSMHIFCAHFHRHGVADGHTHAHTHVSAHVHAYVLYTRLKTSSYSCAYTGVGQQVLPLWWNL